MNNLLALTNLQNGLFTFILGLVVVFFGISIIVCAVMLAGKLVSGKKKTKGEKQVKEPEPVVSAPVVVEPVVEDGISEEVRVAIIAAIAAYYESNQPKNEFTVRKIKKLNNK